jgi:hypothetical protein
MSALRRRTASSPAKVATVESYRQCLGRCVGWTQFGSERCGHRVEPLAIDLVYISVMSGHSDSEISQAWANAQYHLPNGWKIVDLRENAQPFNPSPVAPEARARMAEYARADNASDAWRATAVGPANKRIEARGHDAPDALDRLVSAVLRVSR